MSRVQFNGAGHCDGIVPGSPFIADFSIELYVDADALSGFIVSTGSAGSRFYVSFFQTFITVGGTGGVANFPYAAGVWRFVHDTSEAGYARYTAYHNGVEVSQDSVSGTYAQPNVAIDAVTNIGRRTTDSFYYSGEVGDVKLWDAAVLPSDADQTTNLVLSLGDITGATWDDETANANDYTLNGDAAEVVVPQSITATSPVAWKLIQRDGMTGDILITGTTAEVSGDIEASFAGGAFATIATVSSNAFSGTLADQASVRGDLVIRSVSTPAVTQTISNFGIGDLYGVSGDSNSEGRGTNAQSHGLPAHLAPSVYRQDDGWKEADDPMDTGTQGGSYWPLLARMLSEASGVPVGFVTTGTGSTDIAGDGTSQYAKGGTGYSVLTSQIAEAGTVRALLMSLGPNATNDSTLTSAEYKTAVEQFVADVRDDVQADLPVYLGIHGLRSGGESSTAVRWGVAQALLSDAGPSPGPNSLGQDFADGVHPRSDTELATLAGLWFSALTEKVVAPNPIAATFDDDTVTVTFDADLAPNNTYSVSQWRVNQDDTLSTPSTVTRTGLRTVDLVFSSSITATAPKLRYIVDETHVSAVMPTSREVNLPSAVNSVSSVSQPANPTFDLPIRPLVVASGGGSGLTTAQAETLAAIAIDAAAAAGNTMPST